MGSPMSTQPYPAVCFLWSGDLLSVMANKRVFRDSMKKKMIQPVLRLRKKVRRNVNGDLFGVQVKEFTGTIKVKMEGQDDY